MGLLDDAIREHLELKRRHGANPEEIERAEREALGPVRRLPEEPDDHALEDEELEHEENGYEDEEWSDEPEEEYEAPAAEEQHAAVADDAEEEPAQPKGRAREAEADPPGKAPRPHRAGPLDAETAEYDVEKEGDDVLEETPEFLQDTPDHDRLWFEQRPPRDFDFEG